MLLPHVWGCQVAWNDPFGAVSAVATVVHVEPLCCWSFTVAHLPAGETVPLTGSQPPTIVASRPVRVIPLPLTLAVWAAVADGDPGAATPDPPEAASASGGIASAAMTGIVARRRLALRITGRGLPLGSRFAYGVSCRARAVRYGLKSGPIRPCGLAGPQVVPPSITRGRMIVRLGGGEYT